MSGWQTISQEKVQSGVVVDSNEVESHQLTNMYIDALRLIQCSRKINNEGQNLSLKRAIVDLEYLANKLSRVAHNATTSTLMKLVCRTIQSLTSHCLDYDQQKISYHAALLEVTNPAFNDLSLTSRIASLLFMHGDLWSCKMILSVSRSSTFLFGRFESNLMSDAISRVHACESQDASKSLNLSVGLEDLFKISHEIFVPFRISRDIIFNQSRALLSGFPLNCSITSDKIVSTSSLEMQKREVKIDIYKRATRKHLKLSKEASCKDTDITCDLPKVKIGILVVLPVFFKYCHFALYLLLP